MPDAFESIRGVLGDGGLLVFDAFDAEAVMLNPRKAFVHTAEHGRRTFRRTSRNTLNLETGWTWDWDAEYHVSDRGSPMPSFTIA